MCVAGAAEHTALIHDVPFGRHPITRFHVVYE